MESPLATVKGVWWKPVNKQEKVWVTVSFIWCMILFASMPLWHFKGAQNPAGIRAKVDPAEFRARVKQFEKDYGVGKEGSHTVVEPPPGSHIYMIGSMWRWDPILVLKKDTEYILHLSSGDINHGFNLSPVNVNFQIIPGYDYGLKITPRESGEFTVVCNEFCGIGHHRMLGKIIVEE